MTEPIKVNDRRRALLSDEEPTATKKPTAPPEEQAAQATPEDQLPPLDFTAFILSLANNAVVGLGDVPNPETGLIHKDLLIARQFIDILGMLREKTKGNLSDEESRFFESILYDLRMRFIEAAKLP